MNTRQLEYILAIAEEKIFSGLRELFISQSTLSQTLINLEKSWARRSLFVIRESLP